VSCTQRDDRLLGFFFCVFPPKISPNPSCLHTHTLLLDPSCGLKERKTNKINHYPLFLAHYLFILCLHTYIHSGEGGGGVDQAALVRGGRRDRRHERGMCVGAHVCVWMWMWMWMWMCVCCSLSLSLLLSVCAYVCVCVCVLGHSLSVSVSVGVGGGWMDGGFAAMIDRINPKSKPPINLAVSASTHHITPHSTTHNPFPSLPHTQTKARGVDTLFLWTDNQPTPR
jgi:hypothetical protein